MLGFLFPKDGFAPSKPDAAFAEEFEAFKAAGYPVRLIDSDDPASSRISGEPGTRWLYRGWMLGETAYVDLEAVCGGALKVSAREYLSNHWLPGWFDEMREFTFESAWTEPESAGELFDKLGWGRVFVKDFVKSLKTGKGPIAESKEDLARIVGEMRKFRGKVEGGVVLRRVAELTVPEVRFFVLGGRLFAPTGADPEARRFAEAAAALRSAEFFSLDVAEEAGSGLKVVEVGDGQVSEALGWELSEFVEMFEGFAKKA